MDQAQVYPRFIKHRLLDALGDNPVVLLHGPRQCGKTTLAREVGDSANYLYLNFDDTNLLGAAKTDPMGFVADLPPKAVLDEIQRVPEIFAAIKASVDRDRKPGKLLLTGSSNILLAPTLSDSLAGRMEILRLHPLSQSELAGKQNNFLDKLFKGDFKLQRHPRLGIELTKRIIAGGYPSALARTQEGRRREWYRNYVETLVQRDVRDLARVNSLDALPKLLRLAAGQTAHLLNVSELGSPFHLSLPTIRSYMSLLERIFLLEFLPPWHSNRLSRLIKTPKLHMGDSGLTAAILGLNTDALAKDRMLLGQLLESFLVQEIKRHASWEHESMDFYHFRDKEGDEVDLVIEQGSQNIAGVEIKASSTITPSDFKGIKKLRAAAGKRFTSGVVLYDGENTLRFDDSLFAVPISSLW